MDISRSSTYSARSTNSHGLRRIMIIRTVNDLNDQNRKVRSELFYERRRRERLEHAGVDRLKVSFDSIQIREYPIIMGANPAVSQGPPLTIDWEHQDEENWDVDEYEKTRPERRTYVQMNVPMNIRIQILQESGESLKNINIRSREMKALRIKRLETAQQMYRAKTHERVELFGRGIRNLFTAKKKKEKELLEGTRNLGQLPLDEDIDLSFEDDTNFREDEA